MNRRSPFLCCVVFGCMWASAQVEDETAEVKLTGNIRVDLFGMASVPSVSQIEGEQVTGIQPARKSPWLAAGMSLLIPGAGEFYAESYWKAAAFFAVGVTAWTVAATQNKKGNDQTEFFEGYANQHWSVRQYAEWSLANATSVNPGVNLDDHQNVLVGDTDVNWAALNSLERDIGSWYSHTLPGFGEQQYYELIGKYQQYYQGWDDADASLNTYDQVTAKLAGGETQFTYYSAERGKANDYYNTASTAVTIAVVTHVVSAADAAWSASSFNQQIEAGVGIGKALDGPIYVSYPAFQVSYRF